MFENKRLMIAVVVAFIFSVGLLIYSFTIPSEEKIANCISTTPLTEKQINPKNFEKAIKNYEACKTALNENDKKFPDTNWKSLPTEELFGEHGKKPYVDSIEKFLIVKDSLSSLDNLAANGVILSEFKAEINKDELGVNQLFGEMKSIIEQYKAYDQETGALKKLDASQANVMKKYFNK